MKSSSCRRGRCISSPISACCRKSCTAGRRPPWCRASISATHACRHRTPAGRAAPSHPDPHVPVRARFVATRSRLFADVRRNPPQKPGRTNQNQKKYNGRDRIAIVQVDSPVGVNRRSSVDMTHRLAKEFDGVIRCGRDTEAFQSILLRQARSGDGQPAELAEGWEPEVTILAANGNRRRMSSSLQKGLTLASTSTPSCSAELPVDELTGSSRV
jgi:hypothetical protein